MFFFVLLFTIFIIVVTQKLVLQRSKNVTAKCTENLSPPPCILYSLLITNETKSLLRPKFQFLKLGSKFTYVIIDCNKSDWIQEEIPEIDDSEKMDEIIKCLRLV